MLQPIAAEMWRRKSYAARRVKSTNLSTTAEAAQRIRMNR